jgi:hypothetical protein
MLVLVPAGCGPPEPELGDATEHFLAAQDALSKGDRQAALKEFNLSIELQPDVWSYFQRAQVQAELGNDAAALADCDAGLRLDKEHVQLSWLRAELHKPKPQRFQGRNAKPPVGK